MVTGLTIDELIFKGTHNSYACRRCRPLCMQHPPDQQIDDFGVWSLELDFGLVLERGGPVAVVGHDWPGDGSCWGYYLTDYLRLILATRSLAYRPVFLCLEPKTWKRSWLQPWRRPADSPYSLNETLACEFDTLHATCGDRLVILEPWLREHDRWPGPLELAGKVVLYEPNRRTPDGRLVGLRGTHAARCVTPARVEAAIETGAPLAPNGAYCQSGARVLRLDQYMADWTFDYGVPPNPIVVDPDAPVSTLVTDGEGKPWRCGDESSHAQRVSEHGTFRFPYRSIDQALRRARGVTPVTNGAPDQRRQGVGWTVLLKRGAVKQGLTGLDFPVRLELID